MLRTSEFTACVNVSDHARRKVSEVSWSRSATARHPPGKQRREQKLGFVPALVERRAGRLLEAAVDHAEIAGVEPRVLPRPHAELALLAPAALAEIGRRRASCPSNRAAPNKTHRPERSPFASVSPTSGIMNPESRRFSAGKRRVRQVQNGNRKRRGSCRSRGAPTCCSSDRRGTAHKISTSGGPDCKP